MNDAIKNINGKTIISFFEATSNLLQILGERERDIIEKRFCLKSGIDRRHTLEDIGKMYKITRERVRQIEADSIKKLKNLDSKHPSKLFLSLTSAAGSGFLRKWGGVAKEELVITELLSHFADPSSVRDALVQRLEEESLRFCIQNIVSDGMHRMSFDETYEDILMLSGFSWNNYQELIDEMVGIIKTQQRPLKQDELLEIALKSENVTKKRDQLLNTLHDLIDEVQSAEELMLSYLKISKEVKMNLFGEWGHISWSTISPKKINDKIFLILKQSGRPLHFSEITEKINQARFDHKTACAATVHNELILDTQYVLVGRGIYALKDWGYQSGTVADVIARVIKVKGPLSKSQIMEEVNKQRIVKEATVNLALMNKKYFVRTSEGKYALQPDMDSKMSRVSDAVSV